MKLSRRRFSKEFKLAAIRRLEQGQSMAEVARALEVHSSDVYHWRREVGEHGERAFTGSGRLREQEGEIAQLERKVGQ